MIIDQPVAALCEWAAARIPVVGKGGDFGPAAACGVVRDGDLAAVAVLHDWHPDYGSLQFSFAAASPRWATRPVVRDLFGYAFNRIGAWRVWAATEASNARARRVACGFGMREDATLRDYYGPERAAVILSMTAAEYAARYEGAV